MAGQVVFLNAEPARHLDQVAKLEADSYPEDEAVSDIVPRTRVARSDSA